MKKILVLLSCLSMSASSFATTFNCGTLKYRGKMVRGGIVYQIQTSGPKVFLLSSPLAPKAPVSKVEMKLVHANPEFQQFSSGDLDATLIYNIMTHKSDVTLEKSSNKDWATTCSEVATAPAKQTCVKRPTLRCANGFEQKQDAMGCFSCVQRN